MNLFAGNIHKPTSNIDDEVRIKLHFNSILIKDSHLNQFKNFLWPVDISDDDNGAAML